MSFDEGLKKYNKELLEKYKIARAEYLENPCDDTWRKFCDIKRVCRLNGVLL